MYEHSCVIKHVRVRGAEVLAEVLKASEDATAWCLLAVVTDSFDNNWNHALINSGGSMPYVVFTLLGVRSLLARAKPFRLNNCALSEAGLVVGLALMALVT